MNFYQFKLYHSKIGVIKSLIKMFEKYIFLFVFADENETPLELF